MPTTMCGRMLGRTRWPSAGGEVGVDGEMTCWGRGRGGRGDDQS